METGNTQILQNENIWCLLAYVFTIVSGAIIYVFLAKNNKRLLLHSEQAIIIGIISLVLYAFLFLVPSIATIIALLVWLYGIYIGFEAYSGKDVSIPYITDMIKKNGL